MQENMKKTIMTIIITAMTVLSCYAQPKSCAYILDGSGTPTNVRNAPNGKVVQKLPDIDGGYVVGLCEVKNNWWRIDPHIDIYGGDDGDECILLEGSKTGYWVHYSVLAFGISGDHSNVIRKKPSMKASPLDIAVSYLFETALRPLEIKGDWIKVITTDKRYTGWMPIDRICYNPLTTCP